MSCLPELHEGRVGGLLEIDVAESLVIENSVAAAQNGLGIPERLPGDADARLKIVPIGILQRAVARRAAQVEGLLAQVCGVQGAGLICHWPV